MKFVIPAMALLMLISLPAGAQAKKKRAKAKAKPVVAEPKESDKFMEMLDNTQKLFVIDSAAVGRSKEAAAIPLSKDMGEVVEYNKVFADKPLPGVYLYMNGFGNKCFYAVSDTTGVSKVFSREKLNGKWQQPHQIKGLSDDLRFINYPFMKSDGETFYFSAKLAEGLGGYDIYVSKYDSEEDRFLQAENLGLPYNSYDDDYLYEEDDVNGFAWFASTRRQPDGQACVYTIKTADKRANYDADDYDEHELIALAKLTRIRSTWATPEQREAAMRQFRGIRHVAADGGQATGDGMFFVDDELGYDSADSFTTPEGKKLFGTLRALEAKRDALAGQLDAKRKEYHAADSKRRPALRSEILKGEDDMASLLAQIRTTANGIRRAEQPKK